MLTIAKNFVYLEVALALGWAIYYTLLKDDSKRSTGHFPFIVISIFNAFLFLIPFYPLAHLAIFLAPSLLSRTRTQLLTVMVVGCFGIPALPVHLTAGGLDLFSWTMQATLGLGGLAALAFTKTGQGVEQHRLNIPLILFIVLMTFIALRGTSPTNWLRQTLAAVTAYGIPVIVIDNCLRSITNRNALLTTLAGIGCMLAVVLSYEAWVHWPLYVSLYDKFDISLPGMVVKFRGGSMRAYGPLDEATGAGFALVIAFAAALASSHNFRAGPARYAIPLVIAFGILAPQSRGGILGAVTVLLCYAYYRFGTGGLGKALAALSPFAALYVLRAGYQAVERTDAQDTADYRQQLFTRGMQEFWKSPIVGDTMDTVTARMSDMRQGEGIIDFVNSYLYFGLAAGIIGVLIFCIVLYYPALRLFGERLSLNRHAPTGAFGGFAFGSLLAAGVMLAFTSIPTRPIIITLVIAGASLNLRPPRRGNRGTSQAPARNVEFPVLRNTRA